MSQLKLTADGGGGTVSLKGPSSTTGNAAIELTVPGTASGTLAVGDTGKILQVVQGGTNVASSSSVASQATWDLGVQVSVTPSSASNSILVQGTFSGCTSNAINNFNIILQKKTGSGSFANITAANGAADGSKTSVLSCTFQDNLYTNFTVAYSYLDTAGSTDALSYRLVYFNTSSATRTVYRNRAASESDAYSSVRSGSWIQAMEVAA